MNICPDPVTQSINHKTYPSLVPLAGVFFRTLLKKTQINGTRTCTLVRHLSWLKGHLSLMLA